MRPTAIGLMACLVFGLPNSGLADDLKAEQRFTERSVSFDLKGDYSNVTLTISGPNGFHASAFAKSGTPSLNLRQSGSLEDGAYTYQLTAATNDKAQLRTPLDNGRDPGAAQPVKGVSTSGTFHVRSGAIVKPDPNAHEAQHKRK
jgi:hypothetical protein